MSIRDVAARLVEILDTVEGARRLLQTAAEQLDDARGMFDDALSGSSSAEVHDVSQYYREALEIIEDQCAVLTAGDNAVRAIRDGLVNPADPGAYPGKSGESSARGRLSAPTVPAAQVTVPPYRVDLLRSELPPPVEKNQRQKTHGRWVGPDGLVREEVSGVDDNAETAKEIFREVLGSPFTPNVYTHVEIKLAAYMRRTGMCSAALIINNIPCSYRMGCHELLPLVLPEGYTLTVYGPDGFQREYRGGGKWVR